MVSIAVTGTKVEVKTPYHPDFPREAKLLGGKWNNAAWLFDSRDEDRVRELCRKIYGTDGTAADLVSVRLTAKTEIAALHSGIFAAGRCVARATGRDSGAKLGDGVILLSGRVTSGGSMKNWRTYVIEGSVVEVRDVPRAAVADIDADDWAVEIVEAEDKTSVLLAERERLLARLAEIDAELTITAVAA